MKKTVKLAALALVLILMLGTLVSCSSYGSIKRSFEKNGYVLQNADNEKTGEIETEDGVITYTIHTFQYEPEKSDEDKGGLGGILDGIGDAITQIASTAVVWEFSSDKDLKKALAENEDMQAILEDAQESDFVRDNCILMTANPYAVKIFNGESIEE